MARARVGPAQHPPGSGVPDGARGGGGRPRETDEVVNIRLSAEGIDLYEQLILKKYDF